MNEESPLNWFDKPLKYSEHAFIRCYERGTPTLNYLPVTAKFINKSLQKSMNIPVYKFEINYEGKTLYLLVNNRGVVATTYFKLSYLKSRQKKEKPTFKNYNKYPYLEVEDQIFDYA